MPPIRSEPIHFETEALMSLGSGEKYGEVVVDGVRLDLINLMKVGDLFEGLSTNKFLKNREVLFDGL